MAGTGDLAALLAVEVARRGHTQATAAQGLGVSQQTLSRWLSGSVQPGDDKLPTLAEFLGRPVDEIAALRGTGNGTGRGAMSIRVAELEARNAELEARLARLADRLELLATRLDRLAGH